MEYSVFLRDRREINRNVDMSSYFLVGEHRAYFSADEPSTDVMKKGYVHILIGNEFETRPVTNPGLRMVTEHHIMFGDPCGDGLIGKSEPGYNSETEKVIKFRGITYGLGTKKKDDKPDSRKCVAENVYVNQNRAPKDKVHLYHKGEGSSFATLPFRDFLSVVNLKGGIAVAYSNKICIGKLDKSDYVISIADDDDEDTIRKWETLTLDFTCLAICVRGEFVFAYGKEKSSYFIAKYRLILGETELEEEERTYFFDLPYDLFSEKKVTSFFVSGTWVYLGLDFVTKAMDMTGYFFRPVEEPYDGLAQRLFLDRSITGDCVVEVNDIKRKIHLGIAKGIYHLAKYPAIGEKEKEEEGGMTKRVKICFDEERKVTPEVVDELVKFAYTGRVNKEMDTETKLAVANLAYETGLSRIDNVLDFSGCPSVYFLLRNLPDDPLAFPVTFGKLFARIRTDGVFSFEQQEMENLMKKRPEVFKCLMKAMAIRCM